MKFANGVLTGISISEDINGMRSTEDADLQAEYFMDAFVNALGLILEVAPLSIAWNLGGDQLFYNWREDVLMPQVREGTAGLMINQPFK